MPTAFVTGIAGQDGTILADRLVAEGFEVHGLVRTPAEITARLTNGPTGVEYHVGDLTDHARVAGIIHDTAPDEVYNLAGISSVALSWKQPILAGEVNGVGAVGVFDAAWRHQEESGHPVRVVQASSAEMFGRPDRSPQDESTPLRPTSPYGAAKAYAHHMATIYRERGLHVASCILYNHESPLRPETFVTRKITRAAARIAHDATETLTLGDVSVRRDWGWAADYVDAMIRAMRHSEPDDFVVATGRTHSVAEFVEAAMLHAGVDDWTRHVVIDDALKRPVDVPEMVGRAQHAEELLGWRPTVDFAGLVARMVDHDMEWQRATR